MTIVPRDGWSPSKDVTKAPAAVVVQDSATPRYAYLMSEPTAIVVHVQERPRSVITSLFKFLLVVFVIIPACIVTTPVGPVIGCGMIALWLYRRSRAKGSAVKITRVVG